MRINNTEDVFREGYAQYFLQGSDEEIRKRLKARPAERNCGSDEFIQSQIDYAAWFKKNRGKFQKFIDNTGQTPEETAEIIAEYVKSL